jgi:Na+/proline symporter
MWSVVVTDFIQMIIILIGLFAVAFLVAGRFEGGAMEVINHASANNKFDFWPELSWAGVLAFFATFITLALGSIPQQDVFQRVMSAKDEKTAVRGTVLGGSFYILFCFIPIFITYGAIMLDPALLQVNLGEGGDTQRILPEFILKETPMFIQVMFFGALLSAIMSTASGTLLAPSAIFAENILREWLRLDDKHLLKTLRICVFSFGLIVLGYAYLSASAGLSIFEMVENAYLVTLCGAFVPLAFGVYWSKANNAGALTSIVLGVSTWVVLEVLNFQHAETAQGTILLPADLVYIIPPQLAGLAMAIFGMIVGSLYLGKKTRITKI